MKTNIFYVSEENLIEAVRRLYPDNIKSKDYEYLISIYVKRIFERHDNRTYKITFELNNKHQEQSGSVELTPDETVEILRTYKEEDTPVDFGLAPVAKDGKFEGYSYPFQVKRFIGFSKENFLKELTKFIDEKSRHYSSTQTSLVVIPELALSKNDISKANILEFSEDFFGEIANSLNTIQYSLRSILTLSINEDEPVLVQVWPNYEEYR